MITAREITDAMDKIISQKQKEISQREDWEESEQVVVEGISLETYRDLVKSERLRGALRFDDGKIILYEVTISPKHSGVAGMCFGLLFAQIYQHDPDMLSVAEVDHVLPGQNKTRKPDSGLRPSGLPRLVNGPTVDPTCPWPTVVIEVGVSQELRDLHHVALDWLGTNQIQIVLVIKLWKPLQNGTMRMLAMLYRAQHSVNVPEHVVSFGTAPLAWQTIPTLTSINAPQFVGLGHGNDPVCNGPNMPMYQLDFPSTDVFHGVNPMPPNLPANFTLDLYRAQRAALQ